ncbi:MAG: hypothetical protein K9L95_03430 [Candidatus Omnitrophica bacterium]|nr:hypothetical protein [Candidatus Omnitrophota bacterium]
MYLIITILAAIVATIIWYVKAPQDEYKLSLLSLILWGAALMWFIDHLVAYLREGGQFLEISLDAALLGLFVVIFALLVWEIVLLVSDPKKVFKRLWQG